MKPIKKLLTISSLAVSIFIVSCSNEDDSSNQQECLADGFSFVSTVTAIQLSFNRVVITFNVTNNTEFDFDTSNGSIPMEYTILTTTEENNTVETAGDLAIDFLPSMATTTVQLSAAYVPGQTYTTFELTSVTCK